MAKKITECPDCGKPVKGARGLRAHAKHCPGHVAQKAAPPRKQEEQPEPVKQAPRRRDGSRFAFPFQPIPVAPPIKWPLFAQWSEDVADGDRWLLPLLRRVEALLSRRVRARVHADGPFIELQIVEDPAEIDGIQPTIRWLVDKLVTGSHPFGALALVHGRLFVAPPAKTPKGVLWGHLLIEGEQSKINPWRGTSWS